MFSTVTSALFSSSRTISSPRGAFKFSVIDFLLALNWWKYQGSLSGLPGCRRRPGSPRPGFSILTTSAPSQARLSVQDGPASNWVKSTTRTPSRQSNSTLISAMAFLPHNAVETYCRFLSTAAGRWLRPALLPKAQHAGADPQQGQRREDQGHPQPERAAPPRARDQDNRDPEQPRGQQHREGTQQRLTGRTAAAPRQGPIARLSEDHEIEGEHRPGGGPQPIHPGGIRRLRRSSARAGVRPAGRTGWRRRAGRRR